MAQFQNMIITRAGLDMIAQSQAGGTLIFTKGKLGDGQIGDQSIPDLTDLINAKMSVELSSVTAKTEGHVEVRFIVDNTDLDVGFFVREVGIFAKVNDEGVEKLYGYANAGNYTNYLADKTVPIDSIITKIDLVVGNASNVAFTTDKSIVYVTLEDMENALNTHDAGADAHEPAFAAHNADGNAHKDMVGATSGVAGKRGMVPAPAAGDQNKALFGNGTYKQVVETINNIKPGSDNDVDLHLKFFSSLEQIGLNKSDATPKDIAEILPNNSILQFYAANVSTSDSYVPNLVLPTSGLIRVNKVTNNNVAIKFSIIDANGYMYRAVYHAGKGFTGWKETATTDILPTGTILPFAGSTIPSGFLACNGAAVSRTTYAALYSAIGTTYGTGNGSTTFNLPAVEDDRFLEFASTAGTKKNAGLPNITGQLDTGGDTPLFYAARITGAFSPNGDTNQNYGAPSGSVATADRCYQVSFDASRSSSVYGDSTTVQPKSLTVRAIIKY